MNWLIAILPEIIADGLTCDELPLTADDILIDEPLVVNTSSLDALVTVEASSCEERRRNSPERKEKIEQAINQAIIKNGMGSHKIGVWIRFYEGEFALIET